MRYILPVASIFLWLTACTVIPADRGGSDTAVLFKSRSTQATHSVFTSSSDPKQSIQVQIDSLLNRPLTAENSVLIALLQSPRMRTLYAELGIAQADLYDASRLSNPLLGMLRQTGGDTTKTTWSLTQNVTELLFLNYRKRVGHSQWLQTQRQIAAEVLVLEADVRNAYYAYVGAELIAQMHQRHITLTNAASQYAQQLLSAGNISQLQLSREQAQASQALVQARNAAVAAQSAQSRLLTLLGLTMNSNLKTASPNLTLPLPRALHTDEQSLQVWAQQQRLDLSALREQVEMIDTQLTHTKRWRWFGGASVILNSEQENGVSRLNGVGGAIDLPIFNQGSGTLMRARAKMEATQANLDQLELEIRNDITVRVAKLQASLTNVEEYRQRLIPLREQVVTLSQQQQTFMLIGTFELLEAKQQEMDSYERYLEAVRDYWITYNELIRDIGGQLPEGSEEGDIGISIGLTALSDDGVTP